MITADYRLCLVEAVELIADNSGGGMINIHMLLYNRTICIVLYANFQWPEISQQVKLKIFSLYNLSLFVALLSFKRSDNFDKQKFI